MTWLQNCIPFVNTCKEYLGKITNTKLIHSFENCTSPHLKTVKPSWPHVPLEAIYGASVDKLWGLGNKLFPWYPWVSASILDSQNKEGSLASFLHS